MPQMKPLMWMFMMPFSIMVMLLFSMMIFFFQFMLIQSNFSSLYFKKLKYWKW